MTRTSLLLASALLSACASDTDLDGFRGGKDCDETDAAINAGATELCDGIDNNCDGFIDEGVSLFAYLDQDGDGFGDPNLVRREEREARGATYRHKVEAKKKRKAFREENPTVEDEYAGLFK